MSCKIYYAKKDQLGFPTPGTMMGFHRDPCRDELVKLEAHDTVLGSDGHGNIITQCFHPQRLRYFVRLDDQGNILPDSLFTSRITPCENIADFKKTLLKPATGS